MKPEMIIFDYGKTLFNESEFDTKKGINAVLSLAVSNPLNVSTDTVYDFACELNDEIGRFDLSKKEDFNFEIHNFSFMQYLYEYFKIEFACSVYELEQAYWNNVCDVSPTKNIDMLMDYLHKNNIRTSVISNISISGRALKNRIDTGIRHHFEFIIASSEYVFRKPSKRIFELALRKADLSPDKVWHCGDNLYFDIEGANKSGIFPVWYTDKTTDVPSFEHLKISDWKELIDYIDGLL